MNLMSAVNIKSFFIGIFFGKRALKCNLKMIMFFLISSLVSDFTREMYFRHCCSVWFELIRNTLHVGMRLKLHAAQKNN